MIEIGSTTDREFTDVLLTSYVSLLENNPEEDFRFHIIDDGLNDADRQRLRSLVQVYPNCRELVFLGSDFAELYRGANVNSSRSLIKENSYYRFELPRLVNQPRLLYLDCDLICRGKIGNLFRTDLHDNIIAAVESQMYVDRLGILGVSNKPAKYFNAGLLLIDTKKWNDNDITVKARNFTREHGDILDFQDQDALNAVLAHKWQNLDPKYDLQSPLMRHEKESTDPQQRKLAAAALKNPTIIHYTGYSKPWVSEGEYVSPWRNEYYKYNKIMQEKLGRSEN